MNIKTIRYSLSSNIALRCFFLSRPPKYVPQKRVLITADLDEPAFDLHTKQLLELLSCYQVALTMFSPNRTEKGEDSSAVLEQIHEFALHKNLRVEFASHSLSHEPLPRRNPLEAASIIQRSIFTFREKGIPVYGFRSPYLSTESEYRVILKELSKRDGVIRYDSSTLFEGNFYTSRMHDLLAWKTPHRVADVWELPISCLDDYHLFEKYDVEENRAYTYWKRKVEKSLRKYNYFLLLIHPNMFGKHLTVLERLIDYCKYTYPDVAFVTCNELVEELNAVREEQLRT